MSKKGKGRGRQEPAGKPEQAAETSEPQPVEQPQDASTPAQSGAPETLPKRPGALIVVVVVVLLEALALLAATVAFVVLALRGEGELSTSLLALGAMFGILGIGMIAVTQSLWMMRRWARPAAIAWQILQALFGFSTFQADPLMALTAIVPAVVLLYMIFQPAVLYAFEDAIAYHEAHPSAPAPPPKRW